MLAFGSLTFVFFLEEKKAVYASSSLSKFWNWLGGMIGVPRSAARSSEPGVHETIGRVFVVNASKTVNGHPSRFDG